MFKIFAGENDPVTAQGFYQEHRGRFLVHHPPQPHLTGDELDAVYNLEFSAGCAFYEKKGKVRAMDTISYSLTTHRGCFGECRFCSIALHEGRTILSRSEESILAEARKIAALTDFKDIVDVGGATANMYGIDCSRKPAAVRARTNGACTARVLFPEAGPHASDQAA